MPPNAHTPFGNQWWFTDEFADGPRRLMDGLWAEPEWAPSDESHLLGSSSVVTKIWYARGSVTYSTFDPSSTDVLRLNFRPGSVSAGGRKLNRRSDLQEEGYILDESKNILRIRHDKSKDVDIQGGGTSQGAVAQSIEPVVSLVNFDNPHVGAKISLKGQYPSGVIDWGEKRWMVYPPAGRMSSFSLGVETAEATSAEFRFAASRTLVRMDVYNPTNKEVTLTLRAPEMRETVLHLKAGALQRVTTGWTNRASMVAFESSDLGSLRFDNLAYSAYLSSKLDGSE
jgi:hypothetical protein